MKLYTACGLFTYLSVNCFDITGVQDGFVIAGELINNVNLW